jgi:hypothetical protein
MWNIADAPSSMIEKEHDRERKCKLMLSRGYVKLKLLVKAGTGMSECTSAVVSDLHAA